MMTAKILIQQLEIINLTPEVRTDFLIYPVDQLSSSTGKSRNSTLPTSPSTQRLSREI